MKTEIAKRINDALAAKGGNQSELARYVGLAPQSIQQWIAGTTAPRGKNLERAAQYLGVSPAYIQFGEGHPASPVEPVAVENGDVIDIPLLSAKGSMGYGIAVQERVEAIERMKVSGPWLRRTVSATIPENLRLITAYGDSMEGTFSDGDILLIDTGVTEIRIDAVYALALNGELYIKRLQRRPDGSVLMISDNKKYEPYLIENGERHQFRVLGRVLLAWNAVKL
jgi:phage repressor protein C with HTH and peptisase S24 domain